MDARPELSETPGPTVVCPSCGGTISADLTLWVLLGKWYCSEGCVRVALKKH